MGHQGWYVVRVECHLKGAWKCNGYAEDSGMKGVFIEE